jgi:thioredoxin 1
LKTLKTIALLAILVVVASPSFAEDVKWAEGSWSEILAQAKSENKHIFIDFYTTWCGPCKQLDKITYVDDATVEYLNSIIAVKYDAEKGFGETLADDFKIVAYPSMVLIDPDGNEVDRHIGYLGPEEFNTTMMGFMEGVGTVAYYEKLVVEDPDNYETLFELGSKCADSVQPDKADEYLGRAKMLDPENTHGNNERIDYELAYVRYAAERYEEAKVMFTALTKEYAGTEWEDRAVQRLAYVEAKLGNNEAAVAHYLTIVAKDPEDPGTLNGFAWFCAQRKIGLDEALPVALKAAELSNRSPGILDTLAELHYARGEYDDAIKVGKEALASDPDDQYFNDQIKKFEKAKTEAESQAKN